MNTTTVTQLTTGIIAPSRFRPTVVNVTSLTATNGTSIPSFSAPVPGQWTLVPVFLLIIGILSLIVSATTLFIFFRHRHLRTPFSYYVMNLLLANIACLVLQYPVNILSSRLAPADWRPSRDVCRFQQYCLAVCNAVIVNSHALIAINRTWPSSIPSPIEPCSPSAWLFAAASWFGCGSIWSTGHFGLEWPLSLRRHGQARAASSSTCAITRPPGRTR